MAKAGDFSPPTWPLDAAFVTWSQGNALHRIHPKTYGAIEFNSGTKGNARFSPITDQAGVTIPTIYGGTTFECAAMETVFRDVPFAAGPKIVSKTRLEGLVHSMIVPTIDLKLVNLSAVGLRRLGVQRNQLIDSEVTQYPITRLWAQALHAQYPDVQGLIWVSRQDDRAHALVLFGSRIVPGALQQNGNSPSLQGDVATYTTLLELAQIINVDII